MAGLTRVPAPRSPFDGQWAAIGGLLVVVIVALAIEPWGSTRTRAGPTPSPYQPPATAPPGPQIGPPVALRQYRPESFGPAPRGADWSIRTSTARVTAVPSVGLAEPTDIASGPVVDIGPAGDLDVIVISGPRDAALDTIRLWRFDDVGRPERLDLARLASPWPGAPAWAIGLRAPGAPPDQVAAWEPGLYRLDLLVEPAGSIRMVMLSARADRDDRGGGGGDRDGARLPDETDRVPSDAFGPSILRRLPGAANLWTVGDILTGWARPPAAGDCRVAQIWQARGPEEGCWPVPIGPASALGVNLPDGQRVSTIELTQVDPLPGPVGLQTQVGVGGRPGVAALEAPRGGLSDGIYRMTVALVGGGDEHWYVEVGPNGRQAAAINAFVTSAQR